MNKRNLSLGIIMLFFVLHINAQDSKEILKYMFIGHCYQDGSWGEKVDYRIETFDFTSYKGVWLGGDVCSEAMLYRSTIEYINSIFNLSNPETHWSLGNHDARNGNWEWYEELSGKETVYAYSNNGITRIIMNTNIVPYDCESLDEQYRLIENICDTITNSNQLVLLMHHGIWRDVPDLPNPGVYAQSDLRYWNSNCYDVNSTFASSIYPMLVEVEQRGIDVYCILGDMGSGPKKFDMLSVDGINFLGCGLSHNSPEDNVLIFELDLETNNLNYQFHNLDSLIIAN